MALLSDKQSTKAKQEKRSESKVKQEYPNRITNQTTGLSNRKAPSHTTIAQYRGGVLPRHSTVAGRQMHSAHPLGRVEGHPPRFVTGLIGIRKVSVKRGREVWEVGSD